MANTHALSTHGWALAAGDSQFLALLGWVTGVGAVPVAWIVEVRDLTSKVSVVDATARVEVQDITSRIQVRSVPS